MARRVQESHHISLGFPLSVLRSSWAVAELEQEVPEWELQIKEDMWTPAVASVRIGLQRHWPLQLILCVKHRPPLAICVA